MPRLSPSCRRMLTWISTRGGACGRAQQGAQPARVCHAMREVSSRRQQERRQQQCQQQQAQQEAAAFPWTPWQIESTPCQSTWSSSTHQCILQLNKMLHSIHSSLIICFLSSLIIFSACHISLHSCIASCGLVPFPRPSPFSVCCPCSTGSIVLLVATCHACNDMYNAHKL